MNLRFFSLLILFLTIIKILAIFITSYSFFGDEAQYWLWSKNLDFGYFSKPPLIAWVISFYTWFFGESFESLKMLPVIFYFFTGLAVYNFCIKLDFKKTIATTCALTFLIMPAVSVSSFIISTDIFLIFFWILSMIALINIKKSPTITNFILCGIMLGLAFLSKYAAIYFFIGMLFLCFADPGYRLVVLSNKLKILLFIFVVAVVVLPNMLWNAENGWLTFQHTSDNANLNDLNFSLFRGFVFLLIQILMVGPFLFLGMLINIRKISLDSNNIFLLSFSLPVILIVFVESVMVRANANWAAVGLVGLLIFFIRSVISARGHYLIINFVTNFMIGLLFYGLIASSSNYKVFNRINGINGFSHEVQELMFEKDNLVISDRLLYSSLSYELKDEEFNFFMPYASDKKITKHFQISSPLNKKMTEDFLFIGNPVDLNYLEKKPKLSLIKNIKVKFRKSSVKVYEATF